MPCTRLSTVLLQHSAHGSASRLQLQLLANTAVSLRAPGPKLRPQSYSGSFASLVLASLQWRLRRRTPHQKRVSLLARSRVGSSGLLVRATRLQGIQDAQRKTWPAGTRRERRTQHATHGVGWAQGKVGAAWPNPSFKRSANGRPPAPGRRYAVHFRHPGAGVLPLSPA